MYTKLETILLNNYNYIIQLFVLHRYFKILNLGTLHYIVRMKLCNIKSTFTIKFTTNYLQYCKKKI